MNERLREAEALLEQADAVIEILLGDGRHKQAEELCSAIADHFNKYDDEMDAPQQYTAEDVVRDVLIVKAAIEQQCVLPDGCNAPRFCAYITRCKSAPEPRTGKLVRYD